MSTTTTYQHFNDRVIAGTNARAAAEHFVRLVVAQVDGDYPVRHRVDSSVVDLDAWPDEELFGTWFDEWTARWDITVID